MLGYFYDARGNAIAFREGEYLFRMDGRPLALIQGTQVYRLDGEYVGELYKDMIVDQYLSNPGSIGRVSDPGRVPPADEPGNRGPLEYGYPDASRRLFER